MNHSRGSKILCPFVSFALLFALGCPAPDEAASAPRGGPETETPAGGETASEALASAEDEPAADEPCADGKVRCDGACVDPASSEEHCGECGTRCFTRQECSQGVCEGLGVVSVPELKEALASNKDFLLINVRVPSMGTIPGTDATIPHDRIDEIKSVIGDDRDRRVVLYCGTANRVRTPVHALTESGYRSIAFVDGGATAWRMAGLPVEN